MNLQKLDNSGLPQKPLDMTLPEIKSSEPSINKLNID